MGELSEKRWAVMSERGCEASGLDYEEASRLVHQLIGSKVYGLCVVTDDAARRLMAGKISATEPTTQTDTASPSNRKTAR